MTDRHSVGHDRQAFAKCAGSEIMQPTWAHYMQPCHWCRRSGGIEFLSGWPLQARPAQTPDGETRIKGIQNQTYVAIIPLVADPAGTMLQGKACQSSVSM